MNRVSCFPVIFAVFFFFVIGEEISRLEYTQVRNEQESRSFIFIIMSAVDRSDT